MEAANKVVLNALTACIEHTRMSWVDEGPWILWCYHTTLYSSTHELPYTLVYETDAMTPVKVVEPTFKVNIFHEEQSDVDQLVDLDMVGEVWGIMPVQEEASDLRAKQRYNSQVVPWEFKEGDLVMKRAQPNQIVNKLSPKWVGPYWVHQVVDRGAHNF